MSAAPFAIRIGSAKTEGLLQVSKWLKVQVLLDDAEMRELLAVLGPVQFVVVSEPVTVEEAVVSPSVFAEKYAEYVQLLKEGKSPDPKHFRRFFSSAMTTTLAPFYAMPLANQKYLVKPMKPVVQLQAHHFIYSDLDHKFHPMVFGVESISWGLQFSYPQLFQDAQTRHVVRVKDTVEFPNSALFSNLLRWLRSHTLASPFIVNQKRINAPIRIGKRSLTWVQSHPELKRRGITILEKRKD